MAAVAPGCSCTAGPGTTVIPTNCWTSGKCEIRTASQWSWKSSQVRCPVFGSNCYHNIIWWCTHFSILYCLLFTRCDLMCVFLQVFPNWLKHRRKPVIIYTHCWALQPSTSPNTSTRKHPCMSCAQLEWESYPKSKTPIRIKSWTTNLLTPELTWVTVKNSKVLVILFVWFQSTGSTSGGSAHRYPSPLQLPLLGFPRGSDFWKTRRCVNGNVIWICLFQRDSACKWTNQWKHRVPGTLDENNKQEI